MSAPAAPQPVAVPDDAAAEIIALVKEFGRASDEVGRSRQSNCYAMNTGAVVKACRLEDEIERAVKKLAALAAAPQAPSREPWLDQDGEPRVTPRPAPHKRPPGYSAAKGGITTEGGAA